MTGKNEPHIVGYITGVAQGGRWQPLYGSDIDSADPTTDEQFPAIR
ncbi:Uncharacterised protein [Mycobacteroides abscessus subsp. abscessus]|nr:hypothetical protein [Mycobacteroides abscessus]SIC66261.1 Uncharacterised protein [Mycobacteroides abscessus subsp. abscessus]SIC88147.1 Uncharacterised protein [Mycobacteroides abscessus subsp. abscessus]SID08592.1 Uncharacterised protein [Mycobacteroides abscessus subsp. abscessus]SID42052.1 Uncharacterised protein [Mycobacteroides abscessus subsp. abscessus]SKT66425.1 Uncharacterised protein [Mycobacteroides abscessus subsp. abscessus]